MQVFAKIWVIVALAAYGAIATRAARAGEPFTERAMGGAHGGGNTHGATAVTRQPLNSLDLAAPTLPLATREKVLDSFPTFRPHVAVSGEGAGRLPLGNAGGNPRVPSRAEQLVRNFHRDGLPLARLFQNENSLVHLGLNQKGKPGLWIVEKIH